MKLIRDKNIINYSQKYSPNKDIQNKILNSLNFQLTSCQQRVLNEIENDQQSPKQMLRMLQGDVGSGKTIIALLSMLNVTQHNRQACLMTPTDILSSQHYENLQYIVNKASLKINICLLTGKTNLKEKRLINEKLKNSQIDILIGTHALFQDKVLFGNLGYVIIDEQHRFGVEQRLELVKKANNADILVMTATPIPRSLNLTIYGDMDISKINQAPENRIPIITKKIPQSKRDEIILSLEKILSLKQKIYWVCPLINQGDTISDNTDIKLSDVMSSYELIAKQYPHKTAFIHGKMKNKDKESIVDNFKNGQIDILITTTVIEVGIDVAHATLIVIDNAERYGLAQLHQLRGRVGRNNLQSYCILLYDNIKVTNIGKKRLNLLSTSNDGFYIAKMLFNFLFTVFFDDFFQWASRRC